MEKFDGISTITEKFLNGHLDNMQLDYIDENEIIIVLTYHDKFQYEYCYKLAVRKDEKDIEFITHTSTNMRYKSKLNDNENLDKALSDFLFVH
ncbi:MAG: hypothetical protein K9L74_07305 [Candidatus Izimaplasma sp.]|nr:hypothetical protein [Candidatus Izimaplasma bacterium]